MNLTAKLTTVFLALTIVPLSIVGYLAYDNGRKTIEQNTRERLSSITILKEAEFERWVDNNERILRALASRPLVQEYAATLIRTTPGTPEYQAAHDNILNNHFIPTLKDAGGYLDWILIRASDGQIVVSTDQNLEGMYRESEPFFTEGQNHTYVQDITYSQTEADQVMHISTPVYSPSGTLVAVLVGHVDLSEMSAIMAQGGGLSVSEETYLVNSYNYMVTDSRFESGSAFKRVLNLDEVVDCLAGNDGAGVYKDYRGVTVMGVYHWMPNRTLCIVTEIDKSEAFAPVFDLRNSVLVIAVIVALGTALLAGSYSRTITGPVRQLVKGVEEIGRGNLDYQIALRSRDEFGQLAGAFNQMTSNLHQARDETAHSQRLLLALSQAGQAVQRAHTPQEVYDTVGTEITALGFYVMVFRLTEDEEHLRIDYLTFKSDTMTEAERLAGVSARGRIFPLESDSIFGRVVNGESTVFSRNSTEGMVHALPNEVRSSAKQIATMLGLQEAVYAPMRIDGQVQGVLLVAGAGLDESDVSAISSFANQTATAIENAQLYQRVRHHAENLEQLVTERTAALQQEKQFADDIVNGLPGVFYMFDDQGTLVRWNNRFQEVTGYSLEELTRMPAGNFFEGEHKTLIANRMQAVFAEGRADAQADFVSKDGTKTPYYFTGVRILLDGKTYLIGVGIDITERIRAERKSAELAAIVESSDDAIIGKSIDGIITSWNAGAQKIYGYTQDEVTGRPVSILAPEGYKDDISHILERIKHGEHVEGLVTMRQRKNGDVFHASVTVSPVRDASGQIIAASTIARDITESKRVEDALRVSEEQLRLVVENMPVLMDALDEEGNIIVWNRECERVTGFSAEEMVGNPDFNNLLYPDPAYRSRMQAELAAKGGDYRNWEWETATKDGQTCTIAWSNISQYFPISGWSQWGIGVDVTERILAEQALAQKAEDLSRSNAELEQFAYVASHDLQEPLRMVTSYMQLLQRRYQGELNSNANEFIGFAVDGAMRMKVLINDLLAFSRVGTRGKPFEPVALEDVLKQVTEALQMVITENGANITHDPLPEVSGDETQLCQLFQNLISNGLKFRGDAPPEIHIGARREEDQWLFSVRDNGIGIDTEYFDRIFIIFQRLHGKQDYPGTGIGLAICKKIVQRHQGRIWVESQPGQGSTFYFTLPTLGDDEA